jgi:hypothetical protein
MLLKFVFASRLPREKLSWRWYYSKDLGSGQNRGRPGLVSTSFETFSFFWHICVYVYM